MSRSARCCPVRSAEAADAELGVRDRGVDDEDVLATRRRAVVVDELDRCLEHSLGKLARVGDRGAGADEDRIRAVVGADPPQPADEVGDVAAEEAAVRVQLVDDDELQVLEQLEPLRVVRKDRRVEHVRVRDDDLPGGPHDAADVGRRVAVVGVRLQADVGRIGQGAQLHELVRRQRLGGEEVERPGRGVLRDRVEDRQVVAERLARCGRRDDHEVALRRCRLERRRLVGVERLDPASAQRVDDPPVDGLRPRRVSRRTRLELTMRRDERGEQGVRQQHRDRLIGVARGRGQHRSSFQTEHLFDSER